LVQILDCSVWQKDSQIGLTEHHLVISDLTAASLVKQLLRRLGELFCHPFFSDVQTVRPMRDCISGDSAETG
jgi:hypothetical protein